MKSEIRKSTVEESDQIKVIARQTIDANYRSFLGDEGVDWFIGSGASDQYISDNIDDCWVLLCGDQIMGFCVCKSNLIDLMMVHNNFHRLGYGTMLLKYCEEYLFRNFEEITLESFEGNDKANNFYRKNGWIEKERKFDEASSINKLIFTKGS
jgi:GNAT superfamily N-acetyltransferase